MLSIMQIAVNTCITMLNKTQEGIDYEKNKLNNNGSKVKKIKKMN